LHTDVGFGGGGGRREEELEEDEDEEAMMLLDETMEETEGGAMHPKAEELLQAHLAKADHAGYQRMQVRREVGMDRGVWWCVWCVVD
jgi:hypothetical protein